MSAPPKIFISAVSKELREQRNLVAKTLRYLGFEPVVQNEFGTEHGNIREMLSEKIKPCGGLIQLVGKALGSEVKDARHPREVMSYTHYEADYAVGENKAVWYILMDDPWVLPLTDEQGNTLPYESGDEIDDQRAYRRRVKRSPHLYHTVSNDTDLEMCILKMLHPLDKLRPQPTYWITPQTEPMEAPGKTPAAGADIEAVVRKVFDEYVQRLPGVRRQSEGKDEAAREEELIAELAKRRGVNPKELRRRLTQRAGKIQKDKAQPLFKRAQAAYAKEDYVAAEGLALKAAEQAKKTKPQNDITILLALELAGLSASERRDNAPAVRYLEQAAALTDKARDPLEWARLHHALAYTLNNRGEYARAEKLLREVVSIHIDKLGPEHPDTLMGRGNLANALDAQGKHAEAEAEFRALLKVMERVLGPKHSHTLSSRVNLASALGEQGKHGETEAEFRAVLKIMERVLGAEYPDTLTSRHNLAVALNGQGKHGEAEAEHGPVLKIRERVLGPEHPDSFQSLYNLALCLQNQGKTKEARTFAERAVDGARKVLGSSHPDTKDYERLLKHLTDSK